MHTGRMADLKIIFCVSFHVWTLLISCVWSHLCSWVRKTEEKTLFKKLLLFLFPVYECLPAWIYIPHVCSAHRGEKRALVSLEMELQTVLATMRVLALKPGFSEWSVSALNLWVIFLVPHKFLFWERSHIWVQEEHWDVSLGSKEFILGVTDAMNRQTTAW